MNKENFIKIINEPRSLSTSELKGLEDLIENFPYCQIAHVLVAKYHYDQDDMLVHNKLKRATAYCADRKYLKEVIEKNILWKNTSLTSKATDPEKESISTDDIASNDSSQNKEEWVMVGEEKPAPQTEEITNQEEKQVEPSFEALTDAFAKMEAIEEERADEQPAPDLLNIKQFEEIGVPEEDRIHEKVISNDTAPTESESAEAQSTNDHQIKETLQDSQMEESIEDTLRQLRESRMAFLDNEESKKSEAENKKEEVESTREITKDNKSEDTDEKEEVKRKNTDEDIGKKEEEKKKTTSEAKTLKKKVDKQEDTTSTDQSKKTPKKRPATAKTSKKEAPVKARKHKTESKKTYEIIEATQKTLRKSKRTSVPKVADVPKFKSEDEKLGYNVFSSRLGEALQEKDELTPEEPKAFHPDFMLEYLQHVKQTKLKDKLKNSEKEELIDKFIEHEPTISPIKQAPDTGSSVDMSAQSVEANPELISENLAKINVKQGNIKKAISIYERLILKYPKKKTYFATEIDKLKK